MQHYQFIMVDGAAGVETLGGIALTCDAAALDFGRQIVRDLMDGVEQAGLAVAIVEGQRIVASIPIEPA